MNKLASIDRNNNFDLIRLVAALEVAFHHFVGYLKIESPFVLAIDRVSHCFSGVPVFFTVSGFLIMLSFKRTNSVKQYSINRLLRLYPALWVCFAITIILLIYFGTIKLDDFFNGQMTVWVASQLSFLQIWTPEIVRTWGIGVPNPSLQTIAIEAQWYVFAPCLLIVLIKLKPVLRVILLGFMIIFAFFALQISKNPDSFAITLFKVTIFGNLFYFVCGATIYVFWEKINRFFDGYFIWWFIMFVIAHAFIPNDMHLKKIIPFLLVGTTVSAAFSYKSLAKTLLKGQDISYGIYIYNMLVINSFIVIGLVKEVKWFVLGFFINIFLGCCSWIIIEKKALKLKK